MNPWNSAGLRLPYPTQSFNVSSDTIGGRPHLSSSGTRLWFKNILHIKWGAGVASGQKRLRAGSASTEWVDFLTSRLELVDHSGDLRECLNFSHVLRSCNPGHEPLDAYSRACRWLELAFFREREEQGVVLLLHTVALHLCNNLTVLPLASGAREHLSVLWKEEVIVVPPARGRVLKIIKLSRDVSHPYRLTDVLRQTHLPPTFVLCLKVFPVIDPERRLGCFETPIPAEAFQFPFRSFLDMTHQSSDDCLNEAPDIPETGARHLEIKLCEFIGVPSCRLPLPPFYPHVRREDKELRVRR